MKRNDFLRSSKKTALRAIEADPHPPSREEPTTDSDKENPRLPAKEEGEDPFAELECELRGLEEQAIPMQTLLQHHPGQLEPAQLSGSPELAEGLNGGLTTQRA